MEILNPHYFIYNSDGLCVGFNIYEEPLLTIPDDEDTSNDE
tara:strand:+ start:53 stop:175 length:123 start_codon:yes stop_codon:yes gene_type:complete